MKRGRRELSPEEQRLWEGVTAAVKSRRAKPPSLARAREVAPRASPPAKAIHGVAAKAPPANRAAEKRIRRGRVDIGGTLDLHGHTQVTARAALVRFLAAAQGRGDKAVVVITGVGRAGEGVLRRRLPEWLAEPDLRHVVSGFAKAHRSHGGEGALYVFLRRAG